MSDLDVHYARAAALQKSVKETIKKIRICIHSRICPTCGSDLVDKWEETINRKFLWFKWTVIRKIDGIKADAPWDEYKCLNCNTVHTDWI